jgi:hypothetical protein
MFYLYLKNRNTSSFENETLNLVLEDYFDHYASENYEPVIERIERCNDEGNVAEIILGDLVYNGLQDKIREYRKNAEEESAGLLRSKKDALPNNWRL